MADNRTVSGSVEVEHDGRHMTAFKLMEKIGQHEYNDKSADQASRDYWLKLFVQSMNATYRILPSEIK